MPTVVDGEYEWDDAKAASNLLKHAVAFEEAMTVFSDDAAVVFADALHPDHAITLGFSVRAHVLYVVTTETADRTRIISARRATAAEHRLYHEE